MSLHYEGEAPRNTSEEANQGKSSGRGGGGGGGKCCCHLTRNKTNNHFAIMHLLLSSPWLSCRDLVLPIAFIIKALSLLYSPALLICNPTDTYIYVYIL